MLVGRQLEVSLVNLCDLSQPGLEVLLGLILDPTVFDESGVVVSTVLSGDPTKLVDVAGEVERACRLELVAKSSFHLRLELVQTHPVDGVL